VVGFLQVETGSGWTRSAIVAFVGVGGLLAASAKLGEKFTQNGVIHRLHQMSVKARVLGAPTVLFLTPSRQRHQERTSLLPVLLVNPASGLIAIEHRKTDIEQDDVWIELGCRFNCCQPVVSNKRLVPREREHGGEHVG
jgi:hypothetical protein